MYHLLLPIILFAAGLAGAMPAAERHPRRKGLSETFKRGMKLSGLDIGERATFPFAQRQPGNGAGVNSGTSQLHGRYTDCDSPVNGLSAEDCEYMASRGILGQGENTVEDDGANIWIGPSGPNTFNFVNAAGVPITLIVWYRAPHDDEASFLSTRTPKITYSLPTRGSAVQVSLANGVAGGWSMLYNRSTRLTPFGQVDNTIGEFSTGTYATIDVSRLVNMSGSSMSVMVSGGCVTDMETCVYTCNTATDSCGDAGTYSLLNCKGADAVESVDPDGNPTGGCQGWSNGGKLDIIMT